MNLLFVTKKFFKTSKKRKNRMKNLSIQKVPKKMRTNKMR